MKNVIKSFAQINMAKSKSSIESAKAFNLLHNVFFIMDNVQIYINAYTRTHAYTRVHNTVYFSDTNFSMMLRVLIMGHYYYYA